MPKSLPSPWQLVRDSWKTFLAVWNDSLKISIWYLYYGLVYFAIYLAIKLLPSAIYPGILLSFALMVCWSWTTIRLFEASLRIEDGKKVDVNQEAMNRSWKLVAPLLWIGLLQVMVLLGSCIPLIAWRFLAPVYVVPFIGLGIPTLFLYALLAPPLFVAVRLSFSQLVAIERGSRGLEALAVSNEIVDGNWLQIFLRQIVAGVIFGGGLWAVSGIIFLILGMIVGPEKFFLLADPLTADPLLKGITAVLEGLLQAAAMPLFLIFSVKLYRAARKSN